MTEDDILLAGELALGVLEAEERTVALRRSLAEPDFAAMVTRWREHFALLHAETVPVPPPAAAEERVIAALAPPRASRWRTVALAMSAVAASAVAASLALFLTSRPAPVLAPAPPAAAPLVAALGGTGAEAPAKPLGAFYDPAAGGLVVVGDAPVPAAHSAELWLIAPGKPPRPLGLVGRGDRSRLSVAAAARADLAAGATLALSIEPAGGSPTGKPTGPVIASGTLAGT